MNVTELVGTLDIGKLAVLVTLLAVLIEALTENVMWVSERNLRPERITAMVVSLLVSTAVGAVAIIEFAIPVWQVVIGVVFGSVLLARGANYAHDLVKRFTNMGNNPPG